MGKQKKVGHPFDPDGISHVGTKLDMWISKEDYAKLGKVARARETNRSALVRLLVKEFLAGEEIHNG